MFTAFTGVLNAIRNFIAPKTPAPAPPKKTPAPVTSAPPARSAPTGGNIISTVFRAVSGAARVIQQARSDPGATARMLAEAAARAAEAERRRKEELRRQKQEQVDRQRAQVRSVLNNAAKTAMNWLNRAKQNRELEARTSWDGRKKPTNHDGFEDQAAADSWWRWYVQQTPEQQRFVDEYNKTVNEYATNARKSVDAMKSGPNGWLETAYDKITFGGTRRAINARSFAQSQLEQITKTNVQNYTNRANQFLSRRARYMQAIEASKLKGWEAYSRAVDDFNAWQEKDYKDLMYLKAATEGMAKGYGEKSTEKLTNLPGRAISFFDEKIASSPPAKLLGNLWQYTLGSGDENLPSVATAPSRVINFFGNLLDPKGTKNYFEGVTKQGIENGKSAWQATFNQRNFNWSQPGVKSNFSEDAFSKYYKSLGKNNAWYEDLKSGKISEEKVKSIYRKTYKMEGDHEFYANGFAEFMADPLFFIRPVNAGVKALSKSAKFTKFSEIVGGSKPATMAKNFLSSVKNNPAVKWLGAEHKTRAQVAAETLRAAKQADFEAAATFMPKFARNQRAFGAAKDQAVDLSIMDELKALAEAGDDNAIAMLLRSRDGKLSARDRIRLWSARGKNPRAAQIEDLSRRWTDFTEKMVGPDAIKTDRFGRNKQAYAARIDYSGEHTLDDYDPRRLKKNMGSQTAKEFYANQVNRLFKSDLELFDGAKLSKHYADEASRIKGEYDEFVRPTREAAAEALKRTKSPLGRAQRVLSAVGPTAIWKKAVLKYRPAWYVNNFLYNTQATALSAGGRGVIEQFRLMRPKNYKAAMNDLPADVGSDIAAEVGNGKLGKFANYVENVSRLGSYRSLRARGLSHDDALKRTDRYLLKYGVRNIERPLRVVAPFYSFQKGIAKAAIQMPFYNPGGAKAYNLTDRYQQGQFDRDFDKTIPQLKQAGYSDEEIEQIRAEQAKYFKGKLKVGDTYINTPFNAFSDKGLSNFGLNPWLAAAQETAASTDQWGRPLKKDSDFISRAASKFPQFTMGQKAWNKFITQPKNVESWIGKAGSDGVAMTKEAQGYDPSKPNYRRDLDPTAGLNEDLAAFFGVPRGMKFDADKLVERKTMQKLKEEYFSTDWNALPFEEREAQQAALFKKFGVTADGFYKGELSKYDTDFSKSVKMQKEEARETMADIYRQYHEQPAGTRSMWATKKLRELVESGFYEQNPYHKGFDWLNPDVIAKADRKAAYEARGPRTVSAKKNVYDEAKRTGNRSGYHAKYGTKFAKKQSPYQFEGKFFKTEQSMQKYKDGLFWKQYAAASKDDRRRLLEENPQYNLRGNWTDQQWDEWKDRRKIEQREKLATIGGFTALYDSHVQQNKGKSVEFLTRQKSRRDKTLALAKTV